MKARLVVLLAEGPLITLVPRLLPKTRRPDVIFWIGGGERPGGAEELDPRNERDAETKLSPHAGAEALVLGSLVAGAALHSEVSAAQQNRNAHGHGEYSALEGAIKRAGLRLIELSSLLPQGPFPGGHYFGSATQEEVKLAQSVATRAAKGRRDDVGFITFRGSDRRQDGHHSGDPLHALEALAPQMTEGMYIYLCGGAAVQGLSGRPIFTTAFLRLARARGVRGVFVDTAHGSLLLDPEPEGGRLGADEGLGGEHVNRLFFVYGL